MGELIAEIVTNTATPNSDYAYLLTTADPFGQETTQSTMFHRSSS
jgi:hypothetical protein